MSTPRLHPDARSAHSWQPVERGSASGDAPMRIGRYEVAAELGRGGMGVVYRAVDPDLRRDVAIKLIIETGWVADEEDIERFLREARIGARLRHPGIVSVHEVGQHQGKPYIVLDYVEGASLEALLRADRVPPRRLAEIVRDVARALQHAHEAGVVHRDVKPHNVLVDGGGRPLLTDFGLSRDAATIKQLTLSGDILGTPSYMSPEQAQGSAEGQQSPSVDIWALGAILYRGLCGAPPFEGPTALATMQHVITSEPTPPRQLDAAIHPDLETIALRCLEKEPDRRYRRADAIADELDRWLRGDPIEARPLGPLARAGRWLRRHRAAAAVAAAGIVVVAALGVGLVAQSVTARRERTRAALKAGARAAAEREDALAQTAREEATAAWERLEARRDDPLPTENDAARRERQDQLLALSLDALRAATRLRLARDDPEARRAEFDASLALGRAAADAEQWSLARIAFDAALDLGVEDGIADAELSGLDAARNAIAEARRSEVADVLAEVREGRLSERVGGFTAALLTVVRHRDPQTVAILVKTLDEVSERLRDIAFGVLASANDLTDEERAAGERPIPDLDRSLAWMREVPIWEERGRRSTAITEAEARLERRHGMRPFKLLAVEQRRLAGESLLQTAELCCVALEYIGIREGAVDALRRYLLTQHDELRAIPPAVALVRLGGEEARRWVRTRSTDFDPPEGLARPEEDGSVTLFSEGPFDRALRSVGAYNNRDQHRRDTETEDGRNRPDRWLNVCASEIERGDLAAAREAHDRARALGGDASFYFWDLDAKIRYRQADFDGAIASWTKAIELATDPSPSLLTNRGLARRSAGDLAGSLRDLDRAVALETRSPITHSHRGKTRLALGDVPGAIEDFRASLELEPGHGWGWIGLALARSTIPDERDEALEHARRACELAPNMTGTWDARGVVHARRGELPAALEAFDRALKLEPKNLEVYRHRGLALADAGRSLEALSDLKRARDLAPPQTWWRADVVAKIAELERR